MARPTRRPSGSASPFVGRTLGRCRILRPVGRGATATVFHAHYLPLKRDVAVKILKVGADDADEARRAFFDEARSLARLDHANVVKVFDVVEDGGFLLIIMDFVPGRNLLQVIEEDGPLDPGGAVAVARQVAEALDHAHSQRILHRDVKPANIILDDGGRAVLVDFGNAEAVGEAVGRRGTAHYVAPEVFQGKRQDEKTDTYSLGATLFHLLAGEPPHQGSSVQEILQAHEAGRLRSPSQVNPEAGIPRELDVLVKRSMAQARGYRFLGRDMVEALDGVLPALQGVPRRPRARRSRARAAAASSPGLAPWVIVGLLAVGGVAAAVLSSRKEPPPPPPKAPVKAPAPVSPDPGPGEAGGPVGTRIENRASERAAREAAAEAAFREAASFAATAADRPLEAAGKFAAVASEYGELAAGRRAREAEREWRERALTAGEREARDAEARALAAREKEMRAEALRKAEAAVAGMRFAEALSALDEGGGGGPELARRRERLNLLIGFSEAIEADLRGNPVPAEKVRPTFGRPGEKVVGANETGLTLKGPSGDRGIPWSELKPSDVVALCRQVMRTSGEARLLLATYLWEAGQRDEAKREMEAALLTDRTGTVYGRLEELFGPEDSR